MSISVRPVTGSLGAEVSGVDLREPLAAKDRDSIERALHDHLVLFFRGQDMTDEQHRDFAAQFGELEPFVLAPSANDAVPEMHKLTFANGAEARGSRTDSWHTDGPFMERPPLGTVLRAVELPEYGGDTCWVNMYDVFESLSPAMQDFLEGLTAEHDFMKVTYTTFDHLPDPEAELRKLRDRYPAMEHPVVRTHPVTKRKALFVNEQFTLAIKGMREDESRVLLDFLYAQARIPEYQFRFHWEVNSMVFWDNRPLQHYAANDYYPQRRTMHRVTIKGDKPF
jgi:taurine dioxygenase